MDINDAAAAVTAAYTKHGTDAATDKLLEIVRAKHNDDWETAGWLLATVVSLFELDPCDLPSYSAPGSIQHKVRIACLLLEAALRAPPPTAPPEATIQ